MQIVIREAVKALKQEEPCVIATLIRTSGSTPQKPGAMLLVRRDGSTAGTLGGGCVEGNVCFAAGEVLSSNGGPRYCEYLLNEELALQDGLVCGGTMHFLLEPLRNIEDFLPRATEILNAYQGGDPVVQATVVKAGSQGEKVGSWLLIHRDGTTSGSLGSQSLAEIAREAARRVADYGKGEHIATEDGAELFMEGFTTAPTLVMMGGGHIARAMASLASLIGFRIYVVDDHPLFATPERFPEAEGVVLADFSSGLSQVPVNPNTAIVVATRGHRSDDIALAAALKTPAGYVGLVGSRRKTILIYKELHRRGIPMKKIKKVHAPVGLDIGAITPEEIAVSILAEIIMCRLGGKGGAMKLDSKYLKKIGE